MDIGALAAALWKGKGKGKEKDKEKEKEKEKQRKERDKERNERKRKRTFQSHPEKEINIGTLWKEKESLLLALLRFDGRVVRQDTLQATARTTVFQLLREKNFTRRMMQEIGLTLVRRTGLSGRRLMQ